MPPSSLMTLMMSTLADIEAANPLLKQYLGTPENPKFIFYCILPEQVRFMRE